MLALIMVHGAKLMFKVSLQYIGAGTKGDMIATSLGVISTALGVISTALGVISPAQYDKILLTVIRQCVQSDNE